MAIFRRPVRLAVARKESSHTTLKAQCSVLQAAAFDLFASVRCGLVAMRMTVCGRQWSLKKFGLYFPLLAQRRHRTMSEKLFDYLRKLDLPPDYAIYGSGPLSVRGIIEASNDLDVLCGPDSWAVATKLGDVVHLADYGVDVVSILDDHITFGTRWGIGDFDVAELIRSADEIDSLRFVRLEYVEAYKFIRSSEKDRGHLQALRKYQQDHACQKAPA